MLFLIQTYVTIELGLEEGMLACNIRFGKKDKFL